jgi:hypothetical protein
MATVAMTATAAAIGAMRKKRNIRKVFVYFTGRLLLKTRWSLVESGLFGLFDRLVRQHFTGM